MGNTVLIALNAFILDALKKLDGITSWDNENTGMEDVINLMIEIDGKFNIWLTSGTTFTEGNLEYIEVQVFKKDWLEDAEEVEIGITCREDVQKLTSHIETEIRKLKAGE